ncbi:MAG: hydrogenase 4 subunit B [Pseudorhodobacter sp.]|nr:hydrogenase 4 subunit B [Pseudorhodobacter sp.]
MAAVDLAALAAGALLLLGPVAIVAQRSPAISTFIYSAASGLCWIIALIGLAALAGFGAGPDLVLPVGLPWLGAHLHVDMLSAFFLAILGIGGGVISIFAIGYGRHEHSPMRVVPFYPAFLGAMALVVLAADAFTFLLCWEVMSLLSWALVLADHRQEATQKAGYVYLTMAGFGTMSLLLAFGLLAGPDGAYGFEAMRAADRSKVMAAVILGLMLLGAGSKAGLAPLHVWLPLAHPAAPSHVSALMSGVMTKVALYGFIRVVFDLLGPVAWWASPTVILMGSLTAVLGILLTVMERDIKRALAYSTIENIGVIFAALGLAMAFRANGMMAAGALAFSAALFHIFNHMAFKSLLFMGAGAVLNATGLRDLDRLGGLIHRMPVTSFLVLIGVLAISALPPLNGFASEWLLFQAVLMSPGIPQGGLQLMIPAAGGLLALAAALAAAAFVRIYGIGFLGRPRSDEARNAVEVDRFSLTAMAMLAAVCVLAGVLPGMVLDVLAPVVDSLLGARLPVQVHQAWFTTVPIAEARSSYNGLLVFLFVAVSASGSAWLVHRYASRQLRRAPAWDCGFPDPSPMTQYSAGGFAQPLQRVLGTNLLAARETVVMPPPGDPSPAQLTVHYADPAWEGIYAPIGGVVDAVARRMNRLQFLTIRRYLSLVFLSLILLLLGLMLWF